MNTSLEQVAYKMQPAGHDAPVAKRHVIQDTQLTKAFEDFLNSGPANWAWGQAYFQTSYFLKNITPSVDDAKALLLAYQDHPQIQHAGLFITTVYNNVKQKEIVHDVKIDTPVDWIGYNLPEDKILVNLSDVAELGERSKGTIINYGKIRKLASNFSFHSFSINYGTCQSFDGFSTNSVYLNFGDAKFSPGTCDFGTIFVNLGAWGPLLKPFITYKIKESEIGLLEGAYDVVEKPAIRDYLRDLKSTFEPGRTDYKKAIEAVKKFGDKPAQKIKQDLEKLLKEAGYNV